MISLFSKTSLVSEALAKETILQFPKKTLTQQTLHITKSFEA